MSLTQEQVPLTLEDEVREFLARRFVEISNELDAPSKFKERKEMPYKPQTGDIHYFGDPGTHSYDAQITSEGFWGLSNIGWVKLHPDEGIWSPDLTFNDLKVGITYTRQNGGYIKNGNLVTVFWRIQLTSKGSSTGSARINALPFPPVDDQGSRGCGVMGFVENFVGLTSAIIFRTEANTSRITLSDMNATSSVVLDDTNFTDTSQFLGSVQYKTEI